MTRGNKKGGQISDSRHGMFLRHISVICVSVLMFMLILTGCSSPAVNDDSETDDIIPIEKDTEASPESVVELTEDTDTGINELFTTYFADLAKGDVESLGKIMVEAPDKDTVEKESEYIEDYQNIKCYSKKGLLDDTYVVYVYYEVKFKNIDTLAPSMIREYVCTNEDGELYINNGIVDGEIASWLEEVQASESAQNLVKSVNESLAEAAKSDQKLYDLIAKLNEGAGNEESTAEESETETSAETEAPAETDTTAETSKAETAESETSKAETTKAETTKAETTKAETSEAETKKETTAEAAEAETEYKAYEKEKTLYAQENLNIRKKASADSKLLGKLTAGDSITALGTTGKWTVVSYKDGKAYILSELLGKEKPDVGVSFKDVDETVEATQNVRMRKEPYASAEVAGMLPGGTKVTRTGYNAQWSRIVYNGKTVYVATEYLE